jgi:hypothetical protein
MTSGRQSNYSPIATTTEKPTCDAPPAPAWWRQAITRQNYRESRGGPREAYVSVMFEPEELVILSLAFEEACGVLAKHRYLSPRRREDIALVIICHARRGVLDPHRLALKAIVKVG